MSDEKPTVILSFMVSPVQPFIEAARSLRDLWSGSYILSVMAAHAINTLQTEAQQLQGTAELITPAIDPNHPLLRLARRESLSDAEKQEATRPSLPNKFTALVSGLDDDQVAQLANNVKQSAEDTWQRIATDVHSQINSEMRNLGGDDWDRSWDRQITSYFEFQCVWLDVTTETGSEAWYEDWSMLGGLMEATRCVRHIPNYQPKPDANGEFPQKCSLLGTLEQIGPSKLRESDSFWEKAGKWKGYGGSRVDKNERFCAVSMVKRFAWAVSLSKAVGFTDPRHVRYLDTATIAATNWLDDVRISLEDIRKLRNDDKVGWSGQWLHWHTQQPDKDGDECPDVAWQLIQQAKREAKRKSRAKENFRASPPTYYVILLLDGDNMGKLFQNESGDDDWGVGVERYQNISKALTKFATTTVVKIIERHGGQLTYCGGDDILAFLPADTALAAGIELNEMFQEKLSDKVSLSGGLTIVHYKEDLRYAMQLARRTEKAAKWIGAESGDPDSKNAVAITVCRHSGPDSTVVMGWKQAKSLKPRIEDFSRDASTRWAYKLRDELPTLQGLPDDLPLKAGRAEIGRLLARSERVPHGFPEEVDELFGEYRDELQLPGRNWPPSRILNGFVLLCQAAAFLSRARD